MTTQKFTQEVDTLDKFFTLYCKNKHDEKNNYQRKLNYQDISIDIELKLCKECSNLIDYSFDRLLECPHEVKPRCRKCPNPCYEKKQWKMLAKLMRYSGLKMGLIKMRKMLFRR